MPDAEMPSSLKAEAENVQVNVDEVRYQFSPAVVLAANRGSGIVRQVELARHGYKQV